jgi:hypothetical protein
MFDVRSLLAGAGGSAIATCISSPLDVAKVAMQLRGEGGGVSKSSRAAVFRTLQHIVARDGVRGLWKGLAPSLMRSASYSGIRFACFDWLLAATDSVGRLKGTALARVLAGAGAGAIAALTANPVEVVKTRLQADARSGGRYSSTLAAFTSIYRQEGLRGLWAGTIAHTQRSAVWAAVQLGSYGRIKQSLPLKEGVALHFVSSFICSLLTVLCAHPLDVVKTRMMNRAPGYYAGTLQCLARTVQSEGALALYKGFFPSYLRSGTHAVAMFVAYEQLRSLLGLGAVQ